MYLLLLFYTLSEFLDANWFTTMINHFKQTNSMETRLPPTPVFQNWTVCMYLSLYSSFHQNEKLQLFLKRENCSGDWEETSCDITDNDQSVLSTASLCCNLEQPVLSPAWKGDTVLPYNEGEKRFSFSLLFSPFESIRH